MGKRPIYINRTAVITFTASLIGAGIGTLITMAITG